MLKSKMTRRRFLAATSTAVIAMPYVRGAHAAGKLSIGFWDHWVPGANKASQALCEEWAAKEKVDVSIDYITSQGNKNLLTIAAEAQARSGHDIFAFPSWQPADHANRLEPVDDIMTELIKQNGAVNSTVEYLAHSTGRWVAVPAAVGSQIKGPCSRIDLMKKYAGIDVQAMYQAGAPPKAEAWTLDAMLKAAEACHKAGYPFGIGLGVTEDNVDTAGAIFQSFGAELVDAKGNVTGYKKDREGRTVLTRTDAAGLRDLTARAGGKVLSAGGTDLGIGAIVGELEKLQKGELESRLAIQYDDRYPYAAWPAFALLCAAAALGEGRLRRRSAP